jgi:Ca2+-binding RTX toxin-like protein
VRDRGGALVVAIAVLLGIALVTGAMVLAQTINGGAGYQVINGTAGNDVIHARDDGPDTIDCGAGNDTVYVDRAEDGVYNCETVVTP